MLQFRASRYLAMAPAGSSVTGRRLVDALHEGDERGWDALPLAKELTRLFPKLWATGKAAEHWLAKM